MAAAKQVGPDNYNRSVMQTVNGESAFYQVYSDFSNQTLLFSVQLPNTNIISAMQTINGMITGTPPQPDPVAEQLSNLLENTPPSPVRTLNSPFMPNAIYATMAFYSVQISCSANIIGGQSATVQLLSDSSPNPSTVRCSAYNANSLAQVQPLTLVNTQTYVLSYLVPFGNYVKLSVSGNAVVTLVGQSEVVINQ